MNVIFNFKAIGTKLIQEDNFMCFNCKNNDFYFVLDGHGGKRKNKLLELFNSGFLLSEINLTLDKEDIDNKLITKFFFDLDIKIKNKKIITSEGVCFTGIIYNKKNKNIFLLNLGDTYTYVFNKNNNIIYKTQIHNLLSQEELNRIKKCSKLNHINNNRYKKLSMTRSIGDYDCKDILNEPLISTPSIREIKNYNNLYFLLSTDGLNLNYDINKIIRLINKNKLNELLSYCIETNEYNIKNYRNVDNILFIILHFKNNSENKKNIYCKALEFKCKNRS